VANFFARVELHSATYADYENLHAYMQQRGYPRFIRGDDGKNYQLPTGTYVSQGSHASGDAALQSAVAAANDTGRNSSVIVADWTSAKWQGMPTVSAARAS
jgi:hypothetical protein